jgi:diguanylate cyclase (GGDEF)-like protein
MVALFVGALTFSAVKTNRALRQNILLGIRLRESALRDALTGLRNRAYAVAFAEQRTARIALQQRARPQTGSAAQAAQVAEARAPAPAKLAFLLVDLDHFKSINDTHGHGCGDEVLTRFAELAQGAVRTRDVLARWGGEEFMVVMEVPDREAAHVVAERLRQSLAARPIPLATGGAIDVTCSIGACLFPLDAASPDALTWQETVELADAALYRAKRAGRNRTHWADAPADLSPRAALEALRAETTAVSASASARTSERTRMAVVARGAGGAAGASRDDTLADRRAA